MRDWEWVGDIRYLSGVDEGCFVVYCMALEMGFGRAWGAELGGDYYKYGGMTYGCPVVLVDGLYCMLCVLLIYSEV